MKKNLATALGTLVGYSIVPLVVFYSPVKCYADAINWFLPSTVIAIPVLIMSAFSIARFKIWMPKVFPSIGFVYSLAMHLGLRHFCYLVGA